MSKSILYLFLGVLAVSNLQAQTVFGKWYTIDDETGNPSSVVEIYEKDGQIYGEIIKVLQEKDKKKHCTKCTGSLKGQPVKGLVILRNMIKSGDEYKGGVVTDPNTGKNYRCKIWLKQNDPDRLNVRGYVGILYETKVWHRVN